MSAQSVSSRHAATFRRGSLKAFLARRSTAIRWGSIAVMLVSLVFLMRILPLDRALGLIQSWIDGLGIWGPFALGVVYILATLLFIPGSVLTLASGAIYGLVLGTAVVSLSSTTGAALAFLIARYIARDRVRRMVERSPKLAAVDEAIGEQGWKIVALLRLSPAVPFNLQNYLYGVTAIRFWPCVLVSWVAMLPGTFMYVYIGSLGRTAAAGRETSLAEWALRAVGLVATVAVAIYIARLARNAIQQRTNIEADERSGKQPSANGFLDAGDEDAKCKPCWPWSTLVTVALAVAMLAFAGWAFARRDTIRESVEQMLGAPPTVTAIEAHDAQPGAKGLIIRHGTRYGGRTSMRTAGLTMKDCGRTPPT